MKKLLALAAFLFALTASSHAQQRVLKGTITDTAAKQNLEHALIILLNAKDSTLYKFGRSDKDGRFEVRNIAPGKYKAMVTALGYADYVDDIIVTDQPVIDLGGISLITKAHLLEDVVVRQKIAAIRMKGDTIEYKADSFKVRPGASIEDMLRTVQGFQVDKDGKITANGEKIEKVLVDGEEFFGDDPTVATKNIDAAAVDKFQVYDKKSDQATFTGIDDGTKTKTINFKLKESYKRGLFGKLEAGAGPDDKWNNSLMANFFKGKRKLSFFGLMSSTGKTGLSWDESGKYGGDGNTSSFVLDDGSIAFTLGSSDNFSEGASSGVPKAWSGGVNYGDKYNEDKQSVNGSYRYGRIIQEGTGTTNTQNILQNSVLYSKQTNAGTTDKYRNALNGTFDWMFDSSFSAKLTVRGSKMNTKKYSVFSSSLENQDHILVNSADRKTTSTADDESFGSSLLLRKKLKKPGQTISFNIDQSYNNSESDGFLYSLNRYYDKVGTNYQTDTTDQEKKKGSKNTSLSGRLVYTQPITGALTMELNYALGDTKTESKLLSYDKGPGGKYSDLNALYSNNYAYDILNNSLGTTFRYNTKKYTASVGGNITRSDIEQNDLMKNTTLKYNYNNLFPRASFSYKFSTNRRMSVNYNGYTRQPSITQLQPVADNTNPNIIQEGNPNLHQEFNHNVSLSFNDFQTMKEQNIFVYGYFSTTANAIRNSTFIDTAKGKTTNKYINTNGNYYFSGRLSYGRKIRKLWDINADAGYSYSRSVQTSFTNNVMGKSYNNDNSFNISFNKYKEKFNLYVSNDFTYTTSYSDIRPDIKNNYWTYSLYSSATVELPLSFVITQSLNGSFRQATAAFSGNNNVLTWNASIAKRLFKDKKSELRLSAFDLLDQNKGVTRNVSSTTVTESTYSTLHRYFLLSFIWNFTKNPGTASAAPTPIVK